MSSAGEVVAGIVAYHPDEADLATLVARIAPDVARIVLYANSPLADSSEESLRRSAAPAELAVIRPERNAGLGIAYDAFIDRASAAGARFVFLLDQDSLPAEGTIPGLAALHDRLAEGGLRPAIVGPRPIGPEGTAMKTAPAANRPAGAVAARAQPVQFVISSGSLISVEAARSVGRFRADYFIDAIDLEWCFRARAKGFSIWVAEDVFMDHRLGRGVLTLPFGLRLADQPPRRLYTFLRNQLSMIRLGHVPAGHKLKTIAALPMRLAVYLVRNGFSRECRAALINGLRDGARNRLGPPDRALDPPWRRRA